MTKQEKIEEAELRDENALLREMKEESLDDWAEMNCYQNSEGEWSC